MKRLHEVTFETLNDKTNEDLQVLLEEAMEKANKEVREMLDRYADNSTYLQLTRREYVGILSRHLPFSAYLTTIGKYEHAAFPWGGIVLKVFNPDRVNYYYTPALCSITLKCEQVKTANTTRWGSRTIITNLGKSIKIRGSLMGEGVTFGKYMDSFYAEADRKQEERKKFQEEMTLRGEQLVIELKEEGYAQNEIEAILKAALKV